MEQKDILQLTDNLFLSQGTHKACYQHPENTQLCIKVAYNDGGIVDIEREIKYLKILKTQHADTHILPSYYGPIETNKGHGYVYELIQDYDGKTCRTLKDYLKNEELLKDNLDMLVNQLKELHNQLHANRIITMSLFPINIILQRCGENQYAVRLINDMGSSTFIPLEYYFSYFAHQKIEKRWNRFLAHLQKKHEEGLFPSPLVEEIIKKLKKC